MAAERSPAARRLWSCDHSEGTGPAGHGSFSHTPAPAPENGSSLDKDW